MSRERLILEAAAAAFHEKGFHGVGMDELGQRAGLSGPSLYRYFAGKDEILATLLNEAMDVLLAATEPQLPDPVDDLLRALGHHVTYALANRPMVTLYQREVRSLVDPWATPFTRRRAQYTSQWEGLVGAARPDADAPAVRLLTQGALGLIFSVPTWPERVLGTGGLTTPILDQVRASLSLPQRD